MGTFLGDLRLALRMLAKRPGLTALIVLILALGIGANAAIWSALRGALLAPLPYADADRLVQVWNKYPLMDLPQASVSPPDYLDRRQRVDAFEESALYYFDDFNLADDGPPERVLGVRATATLFPLLRVDPTLGSAYGETEDQPGNESVVVIAWDLWQRRFGGDPGIVGESVRLDGESHRVLGVMPAEFTFPHPDVEIWKPFAMTADQRSDDHRGSEYCQMIARLAPGATIEQAEEQIDAIHAANRERFPDAAPFWESAGFGGMVIDYREELFGDLRPTLLLLQAVVGFVLLIACANVANLLLIRLHSRQKELAVRSALGASRARLARQILVESVVLALAGGALGVGLGHFGADLLSWLGAASAIERGIEPRLDAGVLGFGLGVSLLTGFIFGLLPILSLRRSDPIAVLKEGGRGEVGRGGALPRNFLVIAEVAIAVVLLWGSGLLLKTLWALQNEDPGFDSQGVLSAQVSLPESRYPEQAQAAAFYERALERLRALPGVESVGLISQVPFSGSSSSGSYSIEGYEPGPGESAPHAFQRVIDEDYFHSMGIQLLRGRIFERFDDGDAEKVVIVDRTLVEKYWPETDPIGQRVVRNEESYEVVGVVAPVKIGELAEPVIKETIYYPYRQAQSRAMSFVVETAGDPRNLFQPLRDAILEIDPEQPVYGVTTLREQLDDSVRQERVSMSLVLAFGALAVLLAAVGLYGVLAFTTAQRTREIGLRMALGAKAGDVVRLILRQGFGLALVGVAVGIGLALALGRFLASQLYGVEPHDPATLAGVVVALTLVALLACFWPARRATRVDPMVALREE